MYGAGLKGKWGLTGLGDPGCVWRKCCPLRSSLECLENEPIVDGVSLSYPSTSRKGYLWWVLPRAAQLLSKNPDPFSFPEGCRTTTLWRWRCLIHLYSTWNAKLHHPKSPGLRMWQSTVASKSNSVLLCRVFWTQGKYFKSLQTKMDCSRYPLLPQLFQMKRKDTLPYEVCEAMLKVSKTQSEKKVYHPVDPFRSQPSAESQAPNCPFPFYSFVRDAVKYDRTHVSMGVSTGKGLLKFVLWRGIAKLIQDGVQGRV